MNDIELDVKAGRHQGSVRLGVFEVNVLE